MGVVLACCLLAAGTDTKPKEGVVSIVYLGVGETIRIRVGRGGDKWKYYLALRTTVGNRESGAQSSSRPITEKLSTANITIDYNRMVTESILQEIGGCSGWSEGGDLELTCINLWGTAGMPDAIRSAIQDRPLVPLGVRVTSKSESGTMGICVELPIAPRSGGGGWQAARAGDVWEQDRIGILRITGSATKNKEELQAEIVLVRVPRTDAEPMGRL